MLVGCAVISGIDAGSTFRVALVLVALPALLVMTTLYTVPLLAMEATGVV